MSKLLCRDLAKRLAEARRRAGLSLRQVAQAAGMSQTTVLRVEAGAVHPTVDTLERIARAVGVPAGWLAYGAGQPEPGAAEASAVLVSAAAALCEALGFDKTRDVGRLAAQLDRIRSARAGSQAGPGEPIPTLH